MSDAGVSSIASGLSATISIAGALRLWRVVPLAFPIEALDVLLAIACLVCLTTSVLAWRVTPFGWDWLSEPVPRSPAITSPPHQS